MYNTANQRISKNESGVTTWYVRDAQGNALALYDNIHGTTNWREQDLYGSSRLGMWTPVIASLGSSVVPYDTVGKKLYELDNHLGNVMTTVTDKRLQHSTSGTSIDYFLADVVSAQDYYPFGMLQPGRHYAFGSDSTYRYGFNGKENDNSIKGLGNQQDYGERIYDVRLGRWLSMDKFELKYSDVSPFVFSLNTPIQGKDPDGNLVIFINGQHNGLGGQAKYWDGFDQRAMNRLGDHSARYVDGALGGWKNTEDEALRGFFPTTDIFMNGSPGGISGVIISVLTKSNVNKNVRMAAGEAQGYKDAASIIASLSDGETIKIVTHSMGAAFSRGYVKGIMEYAKAVGLEDKVKDKFVYELNVSPFEGGGLSKSPIVKETETEVGGLDGATIQGLVKKGVAGSVPTVAPIPGVKNVSSQADADKGHAIGDLSTSGINPKGGAGTQTKKPVEEGNNNENTKN